jgi:hypothetical protein
MKIKGLAHECIDRFSNYVMRCVVKTKSIGVIIYKGSFISIEQIRGKLLFAHWMKSIDNDFNKWNGSWSVYINEGNSTWGIYGKNLN